MSEKKHQGTENERQCVFCHLPEAEAEFKIPGPYGFLCNDCAFKIYELIHSAFPSSVLSAEEDAELEQRAAKQLGLRFQNVPKPKEIVEHLDKYVIGQEDAKKTLAVAVYNHYKRLLYSSGRELEAAESGKEKEMALDPEVEPEKSNIIMVGPTGTGKTLLARSISKLLDVPFTIVDATVFTQAGYVGEDVESILSRLYQNADYDVARAQTGIVFIDEIDKIARKGDNPSITRDVSGEGVQQSLLKLLEGDDVNVPPEGGRKHPEQKMVTINTRQILFICAGAFAGIEQRIAKRLNTRVVGYTAKSEARKKKEQELLKYLLPADLKSYGLIPEIVGRLPVYTYLLPLDKAALRKILTEPKNAISKQYRELLKMDGIRFEIQEEVLDYIVELSVKHRLGARGLRSIFEALMRDAMYELPSTRKKSFKLDMKYAEKQLEGNDFFKSSQEE